MKARRFSCEYCGVGFALEPRFLKHKCKMMVRTEELHTVEGTAALNFYNEWFRAQRKQTPRPDAFIHSNTYNAFTRFSKFVKKVRLPEPNKFIRFAVRKDFPPVMWTSDDVYGLYLEYIDQKGDPLTQAQITFDTIEELEEEYGCTASELFTNVPPNVVIHLLRTRRLTPWILLQSQKFGEFIKHANSDERVVMTAIIRPNFWQKKFRAHKNVAECMKSFVSELGL